MQVAPLPPDEERRLRSLLGLEVLDTAPEAEFDAIVRAAAAVCGTPISLVSLVDADRQWFKAQVGLPEARETPRDVAFCAHAILGEGLFEIPDARLDLRFADNPLVVGFPNVRFYAGAPLKLRDGSVAGSLCVIDHQPRQLSDQQREVLAHLGVAAANALEGRRALLAEREARLRASWSRAVLRHSVDAIAVIDLEGTVVHWNAAAERLFGYSCGEMIGQSLRRLIPQDRQLEEAEFAERLQRHPEGVSYQTWRLHADGTPIPVWVSMAPVLDAEGNVTGASKIIRDDRERRAADQRLANSEARFRALSEGSPLGVIALDASGNCTYVNSQFPFVCGVQPEAALGQGWMQTVHPDDLSVLEEECARAVATRTDFDMGYRVLRSDGELRSVRLRLRPQRDADGHFTAFVGTLEDETRRRRIERSLREHGQRLGSIIEATGAGTWEWNLQSGEVRFNPRWAEMLGRTLADLEPISQDTWFTVVHPDDRARVEEALRRYLANETESYNCEVRMLHRNGHWVWVLDRGRVISWTPGGKAEWMFGAQTDITLLKSQEIALRKTERFLNRAGEVAGIGAWEFDLRAGELVWSDQTFRIHGLEPGSAVPSLDDAIAYYLPEAQETVIAAVQRGMSFGEGWDFELPLRRADGQVIWVRAVGHVEFDGQMPVRMVGGVQDVTFMVLQRQALEAANARISLATESGGIGIWEYDLESGRIHWDAIMCRLHGLEFEGFDLDLIGWHHYIHPEDREEAARLIALAASGQTDLDTEFRIVLDNGVIRQVRTTARLSLDGNGQPLRLVGSHQDITRLRDLSTQLARQHDLLQTTLRSIGDAVITTDTDGRVTWMNPVAERLTGWNVSMADRRWLPQVLQVVDAETRLPLSDLAAACLRQQTVAAGPPNTLLLSRSGEEFAIEYNAAPILNGRHERLGAVLVFRDVTEQRRLAEEMNYRASHDTLTGLVNRPEFEVRLRRLLYDAREDGSEHALLFIDLDQFKLVNDSCGHAVGDLLLQQVSQQLLPEVRSCDTVARLGGDEFAIILANCELVDAQRVAHGICARLEEFRFAHDGRRFRVGTSIGLVTVDRRWETTAALMQAADSSCYAAKEAGRNRVHVWADADPVMHARHGETEWATRIAQALDEDRFQLYAQRIHPINQPESPLHAEVLLRMVEQDGSLTPPGAFLPAAERFHLSGRLDRWVLTHAIDWLGTVADLARVKTLCVNLSGQSVGDRAFHRQAVELLIDAGPEVCRRLCLEITETAAITNLGDASIFIEQVRKLGVRIALDDFGAGASSFGYLKSLTVDLIKIDGQFIRELTSDPLDDVTVRCFVDVARVVGVKTVAEHVDRPEVLTRLGELGVDFAQGFLLHRPEPIGDVLLSLVPLRRVAV